MGFPAPAFSNILVVVTGIESKVSIAMKEKPGHTLLVKMGWSIIKSAPSHSIPAAMHGLVPSIKEYLVSMAKLGKRT